VERARLASFFIQNKMPYRAERALQETVNQDIPTEALSSSVIRSLRDDTQKQLINLRVENNLVSTYSEHLPALDLNNDGKVSVNELKNRPQSRDTTLSTLVTFLQNNYKYLDRKNAGAITQADVIAYAKDRLSKINERHFE
jgi:Ca2+-binding EF-hand superfamily protein